MTPARAGQPKRNHLCLIEGSSLSSRLRRKQRAEKKQRDEPHPFGVTFSLDDEYDEDDLERHQPMCKPVWSRGEDEIIMSSVRELGPSWSLIAVST